MAMRSEQSKNLAAPPEQRHVDAPDVEGSLHGARYFNASQPTPNPLTKEDLAIIRSLAGAWSDLDWEETLAGLEEIRRSSKPSLPLEDV